MVHDSSDCTVPAVLPLPCRQLHWLTKDTVQGLGRAVSVPSVVLLSKAHRLPTPVWRGRDSRRITEVAMKLPP